MRKPVLLILFAAAFYTFSYSRLPAVDQPDVPIVHSSQKPVTFAASSANTRRSNSVLTRANFEDVVRSIYDSVGLADYNLDIDIFRKAMVGYYALRHEGALNDERLLTIINFEQPSTEKRFYTIDLLNKKVKYHTYVAHGRNTGENLATKFSNVPHSNQSSLGFYVTAETYFGGKGYSLRLDGMEKSFNDKIRGRAVVIHGADYVSEDWIRRYGRLGRSQGCPALPPHLNKEVIDTIKGGTAIFTYYPEEKYLNASKYLETESLFQRLDEKPIRLAVVSST